MDISDEEVRELLPQKPPFRFIKSVVSIDLSQKKIICTQTFQKDEFFFKGHFPGNPIVPGVLIIECMAQSALLLISQVADTKIELGYLVKVENSQFKKLLKPDTVINVECKITRKIGKFFEVTSVASSKDSTIAKATLVLTSK